MMPPPSLPACSTSGCSAPGALKHDHVVLCVPCYRATPGTILEPGAAVDGRAQLESWLGVRAVP